MSICVYTAVLNMENDWDPTCVCRYKGVLHPSRFWLHQDKPVGYMKEGWGGSSGFQRGGERKEGGRESQPLTDTCEGLIYIYVTLYSEQMELQSQTEPLSPDQAVILYI